MSKDKYYQWVVSSNEDVAAVLFLSFHGDNNEDYEKEDIVPNIEFECIVPSIKNSLFISA